MNRSAMDCLVVGGGIAGLASAWQLAERGARVRVLEREPLVGTHSTARNAAIWLPCDVHGSSPWLTRRSAELLDGLLGPGGWVRRTGGLVTAASPDELEDSMEGARRCGSTGERLDEAEIARQVPALEGGMAKAAVHVKEAGVLDIHAMTEALGRAARAAGVTVETGVTVRSVRAEKGRVRGVILEDGTLVDAGCVLLAPGAWAAALGASCGAPVPAIPLRRHLVQMEVDADPGAHIVWHVGDEVYYRPESGGVLASPCDQTRFDPCIPPTGPDELDALADKLPRLAPGFERARVRRAWACLRTYTEDRELVAGPDPRVEGLGWLAGLGGRGMTVGAAAGELAAALLAGEAHPLADVVTPGRFC